MLSATMRSGAVALRQTQQRPLASQDDRIGLISTPSRYRRSHEGKTETWAPTSAILLATSATVGTGAPVEPATAAQCGKAGDTAKVLVEGAEQGSCDDS
jgi:hypothetical protein